MESWVYAVLFGIASILGLRGSIRVTRRYVAVRDSLMLRESSILLLLVFICWVITGAALWFGILNVRRLLGFEPLPELIPISALIATVILFVPTLVDVVVDRVARVPWEG